MSQKDIQDLWEGRITKAKAVRETWAKDFNVNLGRDYFSGKQNPGYPADEWITINKIYSHLQAELPTLYNVDPYFYIKLKKSFKPDPMSIALFEQRAKIRQSMLNYLKTELKLKEKARLGIQDAHFSYGVAKVRFAADELENPDKGKPILSEKEDEEGKQLALVDDEGNTLIEPDTVPINERYEILRLHPDDFLFSDGAGPLDDKWHWVAERIRTTKEEAKKDRRLNRRVLNSLVTKSREDIKKEDERAGVRSLFSNVSNIFKKNQKKDKSDDIITYWEIYDLDNKTWLVIAEDGDAPLVKPSKPPKGIEGHPYSILRFTLQDNSPYPIPPVSQAIDPQKEFCLARSRMMTHRKRFNRKYEVGKQAGLDSDGIAKLETGDDGTILEVAMVGQILPIKDAPLDQMGYVEISALSNDLNEIFGSPGEARGIAEADSATQAGILEKRLQVREGDRLSIVIDWIIDIAKKLDQLVQANISGEEAIRITGPQGEFWEFVKEEDFQAIEGEFEYSVNVGATTPQLPDIERSQWLAFMSQVVIPMPHILTAPHFMKKMAQMFHIEDDAALEELRQLGLKMMSGQLPLPGNQGGGPPGGSPESQTLGAALGSLGGNVNGGGAQI